MSWLRLGCIWVEESWGGRRDLDRSSADKGVRESISGDMVLHISLGSFTFVLCFALKTA